MANSKKSAEKNQHAGGKNRGSAIVKHKPVNKSKSKENIPVNATLSQQAVKLKTKTKKRVATVSKNRGSVAKKKGTSKLASKSTKNGGVLENETERYVVEAFLDEKMEDGSPKVLVKWKDWPVEDNTWEPLSNLDDCSQLLREYRKRRAQNNAEIAPDLKTQKKRNDKSATKGALSRSTEKAEASLVNGGNRVYENGDVNNYVQKTTDAKPRKRKNVESTTEDNSTLLNSSHRSKVEASVQSDENARVPNNAEKTQNPQPRKGKTDKSTTKGDSTKLKAANQSGKISLENGGEGMPSKEDVDLRNNGGKTSETRPRKGKSVTSATKAGDSTTSKSANESGKLSLAMSDKGDTGRESGNVSQLLPKKNSKTKRSSLKESNVAKSSAESRMRSRSGSRSKMFENVANVVNGLSSGQTNVSKSAAKSRTSSRSTSRKTSENIANSTNEELFNGSSICLSLSADETQVSMDESQESIGANGSLDEIRENSPAVLLKQYAEGSAAQYADLSAKRNRNSAGIQSSTNSSKSVAEKSEPPRKPSTSNDDVQDSDEEILKINFGEEPKKKIKKAVKKSKKERSVRSEANNNDVADGAPQRAQKNGDKRASESNVAHTKFSEESNVNALNRLKKGFGYKRQSQYESPQRWDINASANFSQELDQSSVPPPKKKKQLLVIDEKQNVHLIPRKIHEALQIGELLKFKVMLKKSRKLALVDNAFMKEHYQELLLDYYEKRIVWKQNEK